MCFAGFGICDRVHKWNPGVGGVSRGLTFEIFCVRFAAQTNRKPAMDDENDWRSYYLHTRVLPDGNEIGLMPMAMTWGLFYGLCDTGNSGRFCYPCLNTALAAYCEIEKQLDQHHPPADPDWIKHKGRGGEYSNPQSD